MPAGHQAEHLSEEAKALIRGANFGHLATLMRDGAPHIDPVWIDLEGDKIIVCSGTGSLKAKHTKRDPRVGLSVIAMDNPYREAQIRGRVVEQRPDPDLTVIDRVSHIGLTKSAALEYAAKGIRINAVCPGTINTPIVEKMLANEPDAMKEILRNQPIGRLGQPEEIAAAVLWLCSPGWSSSHRRPPLSWAMESTRHEDCQSSCRVGSICCKTTAVTRVMHHLHDS